MWSPNELLKTEKQRDILSYITLQFFPFKKVPLEHYPLASLSFLRGGWQPAACIIRPPLAGKFHTCGLRSVNSNAHVVGIYD